MHHFAEALAAASQLVLSGDPHLVAIVSLSLSISLTAVLLASILGLPFGAAEGIQKICDCAGGPTLRAERQ